LKNVFSSKPFSVAWFLKNDLKKKVSEIIDVEKPDHIFCHLIRMSEYVRDVKDIPKTLDYMDAFSAGMMRLKNNSSLLMKLFSKVEHHRLLNYEKEIFKHFNHHIIISKQDAMLIPHPADQPIEVITNGVDFDFYKPQIAPKKYDLLFAGNMNYPPNIIGVTFIAEKVIPLLKREFPYIKFVIAGANPSSKVKSLQSQHVEVTGWVDDIRTYFYESRIMLAPMFVSIGLQNKILQAMAMKTPCIISSLANNAINATAGQSVLIANTAEDYATKISELLRNDEKQKQLAENAFHFVKENYNWEKEIEKLSAIVY
jgi:polysaccharide biosynthesis protein PslH